MRDGRGFRQSLRLISTTAILFLAAILLSAFCRVQGVTTLITLYPDVDPCTIRSNDYCYDTLYILHPYPGRCNYYCVCTSGRWESRQCPPDTYFSSVQRTCTFPDGSCTPYCSEITTEVAPIWGSTAVSYDVDPCTIRYYDYCSEPSFKQYPSPGQCNYYYYCYDGRWYNNICGAGEEFSTIQHQCAYPDGSCLQSCPDWTTYQIDVTEMEVTRESYDVDPCTIQYYDNCTEPSYKQYPYPGVCSYYYYCYDGMWIYAYCGSGREFSTIQHQCAYPDGSCFPYCPETTVTGMEVSTVSYDVDPCTIQYYNYCSEPSYKQYPYPGQCNRYYFCNNGWWDYRTCSPGLYFSTIQHQCASYDGSCFSYCPESTTNQPDVTRMEVTTESYDVDPCTIQYYESCTEPSYKQYPFPGYCNVYYYCYNGRWNFEYCSSGLQFSTIQNRCTNPDGSCFPYCPESTVTHSPETTTSSSYTTMYWTTGSTDSGQCRATPCVHGSLCFDDSNQYKCECETGYTGQFCEQDKCMSTSSPCVHGTICFKEMGSYKCDCYPGYTGFYCENRIDHCASRPCDNGATCLDNGNGYVCHCQAGYTGLRCETDVNHCVGVVCRNGGVCEDLEQDFVCNCSQGFTGRYCEYNINECESSPCVNDSTCVDLVGGYRCQCLAGFTGVNCEIDVDECASSPCQNNGTCEDLINAFKCECSVWSTGKRCEIERCTDPVLIQQHLDGPFFYKSWQEMMYNLGSPNSYYWFGLNNLNYIIQNGHSGGLMVVLTEINTNKEYFAKYEHFHVGTAGDNFRMTVSGFSGNAGDALGFHSGAQFSTWDRDNDLSSNNLAEVCGAFWYNSNSRANIAADSAMLSFAWYPEDRYVRLAKNSMYICRSSQDTTAVYPDYSYP